MSAGRFKKGCPGGPGRPKVSGQLKELRKKFGHAVDKCIAEFALLTRNQLKKKIESPRCTVLQAAIGAIFIRAIKDGDANRLHALLDRSLGKIPNVNHNLNENEDVTPAEKKRALDMIPREKLIALVRDPEEGTGT